MLQEHFVSPCPHDHRDGASIGQIVFKSFSIFTFGTVSNSFEYVCTTMYLQFLADMYFSDVVVVSADISERTY